METQTVTIEVAPQVAAILLTLQQRAEARGKTLYAFLRELIQENENGAEPALAEMREENGERALTPYELVKDLIGSVDSSMPDPDPAAKPRHTAFGAHLLEEHRKQVESLP